MPKPFTVLIEIEKMFVGEVIEKLNKMRGISKFDIHLGQKPKPNGHADPRAPRNQFAKSGAEFILELLFKNQLSNADLKAAFEADSRSPASTSSILHNGKKAGDIVLDKKTGKFGLSKKARDRLRHRKANR
jgi:hypothetical protein